MYLRSLTQNDEIAVSILLDSAFGDPSMYRFALALRKEGAVAMERVVMEGDAMIGYVCYAKMVHPDDWWALSILAVSPDYRKRGTGREIVTRGMDDARREGAKAVVVVGDPKYFSRVGFSKLAASKLEVPFLPEYTLLYPIAPGTGMVNDRLIYPAGYSHLNEDVL